MSPSSAVRSGHRLPGTAALLAPLAVGLHDDAHEELTDTGSPVRFTVTE